MTATTRVPLVDLPDGEARKVVVDGTPVCLVRVGDRVYAIGDVCTHQDISLAEGEVDAEECTIECWKHGSAFSLETGEPITLPATRPVPVFPATIDDGAAVITVPTDGGDP
jgi:3-phenylpropionate/trans-cinnamate dioxygenase ferredoxin component